MVKENQEEEVEGEEEMGQGSMRWLTWMRTTIASDCIRVFALFGVAAVFGIEPWRWLRREMVSHYHYNIPFWCSLRMPLSRMDCDCNFSVMLAWRVIDTRNLLLSCLRVANSKHQTRIRLFCARIEPHLIFLIDYGIQHVLLIPLSNKSGCLLETCIQNTSAWQGLATR